MLSIPARRKAAAIALSALVAPGFVAPPAAAEPPVPQRSIPEISAHAGGAGQWPENSAKALRGSVAAGYYMVESDVLFTKDLIGVMAHDDKLGRECTKPGATIHSLTYAHVQRIRCNGEPIPTLSEAISIVRGSPTILNLDVKTYSGQSRSSQATYATLAARALVEGGMIGRATMQTFAWEVMLPAIRRITPSIEVTALEAEPSLSRVRKAAAAGVDRYAMNVKGAKKILLDFAKAHSMKVGLWSLTTASDILFAVDMGMNPISSDRPDDTAQFLDSRSVTELNRRIQVTDRSPYRISSATYRPGKVRHSTVMGRAVPSAKAKALLAVVLSIKVTNGSGEGLIDVSPTGSRPGVDGVRVPMPRGTATLTVHVPPGDSGKVSIVTTASSARLTVKVTGYETLAYDTAGRPA